MTYLNVHVLSVHPYSNLNRDDTGAPKSVAFGGAVRARLSSQALKRAARLRFETTDPAERTQRSKYQVDDVMARAVAHATAAGATLNNTQRDQLRVLAVRELRKLTHKDTAKGDSASNAESARAKPSEKDTLTWLAEAEIDKLALKLANQTADADLAIESVVSTSTDSLTIAAFGRMFAARPLLQTEAAAQVAHAFTTHRAAMEIDYFTAVDDLQQVFAPEKGHAAAHTDLAEFTTGVFYRYFNLDTDQLARNWSSAGQPGSAERLRGLLEALILSVPSGKQATTAAATFPLMVLACESRQPFSFADAFERPVPATQSSGYADGSADTLAAHFAACRAAAPSLFGSDMTYRRGEPTSLDEVVAFGATVLGGK